MAGTSSRKSYKLLESLPPHSRHSLRVRVFHHILAREVEFRILPQGADSTTQTLFFRELKDLIKLDHPAFLPVLQRGKIRGLHCYTVPLRFHETLGGLVNDTSLLGLEDRARALRSLASALCAAHHQDMVLGAIPLRHVAWDPVAGGAYFLHHRPVDPDRPDLTAMDLPKDVQDNGPRNKPADVYHWGVTAYWLLSKGRLPKPGKDGKHLPLREVIPSLDRGFSATIDTCLSRDPELRPQDGAELNTVLQLEFHDRGEPSFHGQLIDLAPELSLSVAPDLITQSLRKLRKTGRIPAALAAPAPDPARAASGEGLPEDLAGDLNAGVDEPDDEVLRSGTMLPKQDLDSSSAHPSPPRPPERPARRRPPDPPSGVQQIAVAPPKPPPRPLALSGTSPGDLKRSGLLHKKRRPALLEGVLAGFVLGFAVGGWAFYLMGGSPAPPPDQGPRVTVHPGTPTPVEDDPAPVGEVTPLPPSVQARFHQDRFIRRLARRTEVPPERFDETWKVVRMLSIRKRLPPSINDRRRIMAIRKSFDEDADAGSRDLMAFLDDLRTVVGTPVGDSGQWQ